MADTQRTQPPKPGTRRNFRIDQQVADDLAVLMATGDDMSTAVRTAVAIVATMYRTAWTHGITPTGVAPHVAAYQLAPPHALATPVHGLTSRDDSRPYPVATTPPKTFTRGPAPLPALAVHNA